MEYGEGVYLAEGKRYQGRIILDEKLYIKGEREYPETYVPLEKIEAVKIKGNRMEIKVTPSVITAYIAVIEGKSKELKRLIKSLAQKLGFKKNSLKRSGLENHTQGSRTISEVSWAHPV